MNLRRWQGVVLIAPAALLLLCMFIVPVLYFAVYSIRPASAVGFAGGGFTLGNFGAFFRDGYLVGTLIRSVIIGAVATLGTLALSLPLAYGILKSPPWLKSVLVILTIFPMLIGSVVRSIGWVAVLGYSGLLNGLLLALHLRKEPLDILQTTPTLTLVMSSILVPVMVMLIHASMAAVDPATERAALSLGTGPNRTFWRVMFPQIMPGVVAGTSLVFVLSVNAYATPLLVGGSRVPMIAPEIYNTITSQFNLPGGSAIAVVVVVISLGVVGAFGWFVRRRLEVWRVSGR